MSSDSDFEDEFNRLVKERTKAEYRRLREEYGYSQAEMAERLECSSRNYQNLEHGEGTANLTIHLTNFAKLTFAYLTGSVPVAKRRISHVANGNTLTGQTSGDETTPEKEAKLKANRISNEILQRLLSENEEDK